MRRKIIFATDFSENNKKAYEFLKRNYQEKDEVILCHVISDSGYSNPAQTEDELNRETEEKKKRLDFLATQLKCATKVTILKGDTVKLIQEYIEKELPEMLIIGSHRYGPYDRLLNRDLRKDLLKRVSCPIVCC